jgi:hypothetical protein
MTDPYHIHPRSLRTVKARPYRPLFQKLPEFKRTPLGPVKREQVKRRCDLLKADRVKRGMTRSEYDRYRDMWRRRVA